MNIPAELIRIFHAAVPGGESLLPAAEVNTAAMRAGYFVEAAACTPSVLEAMKGMEANYNTTFYRDEYDVLERSRFELLVDQLIHYASTYGTDFTAPVFTLNPEPAAMLYKTLTTVRAVSEEEMFELCLGLINGGALKNQTVTAACRYIASYICEHPACFDIKDLEKIRNNEARCILYSYLKRVPENPTDFLRVAVYAATGSAMLINSPELLQNIERNAWSSGQCRILFSGDLPRTTIEGLAGIFFRFRHIFIAFKRSFRKDTNSQCTAKAAALINYLRTLAPRYKKPFRPDALQAILSPELSREEIDEALKEEKSTFRLVRILGYLQMTANNPKAALYIIRNGKTYIKDRATADTYSDERIHELREKTEAEIIARLKKKVDGRKIKFPESLALSAPVSEKSYVGNVPFLSSCGMGDASFVGVYWRGEWGAHDFDLSGVFPYDDIRVGWNDSYTTSDDRVIYSGDMTSAEPEASEILYFRNGAPEGFVFVNRFSGDEGAGYRLFFGVGEPREVDETIAPDPYGGLNFGVREMDIRVEADVKSDVREQLTGYISSGRFYFLSLGIGRGAVSHKAHEYPLQEALQYRALSAVNLRELLLKAGAIEARTGEQDVDIDLSEHALTRTSVSDLFR